MERKEQAEQEMEQSRIKSMADRNEIFNCSGGQVHTPGCDENCGVRELTALEVLINDEHKKWQELGMVPIGCLPQFPPVPGVPIDTHKMSVALAALTQMCYEIGIDKDKLNEKFQEMYLERLINIREANEESMRESQRRQGIAVAGADVLPQLHVPDYISRKMH